MSFDGWKDQDIAYSEMLLSLNKEGNPPICDNRDEPWGHDTEISQTAEG